ncbi:MAG: RNA polymerase sigma factor SigY [Clostridium lundense]|nr:RNA polymerase sigma factor SigY [Clostridium lundense]
MEEKNLLKNAKEGDKNALTILINENYQILTGYAIKLIGNEELAKDIVQETLLKAIINLEKFKPQAKFSTWLITIATNLYKDYLRKNKEMLPLNEELMFEGKSVDMKVIDILQMKEVFKILSELSYEKRTVFILKHYYNYKYDEIAQIVKCPVGTVRSRLHSAVNSIIVKMKESGIINE